MAELADLEWRLCAISSLQPWPQEHFLCDTDGRKQCPPQLTLQQAVEGSCV